MGWMIATPSWVYPRVGGGTLCYASRHLTDGGLSPRGRGNLTCSMVDACTGGSIPAWAGEPIWTSPLAVAPRVYPRVGGGTVEVYLWRETDDGLSPRGRGNPYLLVYSV